MELYKNLPAVVVRGTTPIPNNDFRIEVGRKISLKAIEEAETNFEKYVIILIQKNPLIESPAPEDIEEYGVLAKVAMKIKLPSRSEEHTSELQSRPHLVCRLLLEKKKIMPLLRPSLTIALLFQTIVKL